MLKLTKKQFLGGGYTNEIKKGAIFIYPTDTIYGLGCDATNEKAVEKIRKIKDRNKKPFSVIVPTKRWILDNCYIEKRHEKFLKKLPGKYTLILRLKNKKAVAKNVSQNTLGVRIPKNWFSNVVKTIGIPIVTTSVNLTNKKPMTSLEDLDKEIIKKVDFLIYEGKKSGKPSTIVDLTEEKAKIIKR